MPAPTRFELRLPREVNLPQDQEWCEVVAAGRTTRVRFHNYADIYAVPGLYERLFHDELACDSPSVMCALLRDVLGELHREPGQLRVLDIGAGNGMVGEQLAALGVTDLVGLDALPEAAAAAARDRPGLYREYHVTDLADPPPGTRQRLGGSGFTCLTAVGVLGFGDLPPHAFATALSYLTDSGIVAFSIKEEFLTATDRTGYRVMLRNAFAEGHLIRLAERRYQHRLAVSGSPLHYVAYVAVVARRSPGPAGGGA